jgi:hypothetical protein
MAIINKFFTLRSHKSKKYLNFILSSAVTFPSLNLTIFFGLVVCTTRRKYLSAEFFTPGFLSSD